MPRSANQEAKTNGTRDQVKVWDVPLRLFHWALVIAITMAFLSSEEDSGLNDWHVLSGWLAGILIVFRLIWGVVGSKHSRFADFIRRSRIGAHLSGLFGGRREPALGHNPLGAVAMVAPLALIAGTNWTGAFGGEATGELHEVIAWTLLAMVGVRVAAVIVVSVIQRDNLVRAMVTGSKPAIRQPGAEDARAPTPLGFAIAVLGIAGAVYAVFQYDPQAFTLRNAEAFEHRSSGAGDRTNGERERQFEHED